MSIWDKIRQLFSGQVEEKSAAADAPASFSLPVPEMSSAPKEAIRNQPGSKKKTMINTVTLSSDLSELFLIDSGRAIGFSLDTKAGVVLGLLNGQLAVVSGIHAPIFEDAPELPTPGDGPVTAAIKSSDLIQRPIRLMLGKNRHYTISFHEPTTTVSVIGVIDIDSTFKAQKGGDHNCVVHPFTLKGRTITVRRVGNALEIIPSDR